MLTIFDEMFLLALDEEKGNIFPFAKKPLVWGVPGAILAELALMDKVCTNENHRLELRDAAPTGDGILDKAVDEIHRAEKARKLTYWVSQFSLPPKELRYRLGERLADKNVLYQEDKRFFRLDRPAENGFPALPNRFEIKTPLRAMILADGDSDQRSLALLTVLGACDLLSLIFTLDELPSAKRRIHEKVLRTALENPAMQTIEEIEEAVSASMESEGD